jgi:FkbM family methyltransferase
MLGKICKLIRPILNEFRKVNKFPPLEKFIAKRTQGKQIYSFWSKLLPPLESYRRGSIRVVKRNGINYCLDISDYLQYVIYFGLDVEPKETLFGSIKDGMYVFDIGTNIGETLLNISRLNPSGKNYGFEPVPFLFEKAKQNILLNDFKNIYLSNLALSDKSGVLYFDLPSNRNFGSINMSLVATPNSKEVKAITFDEFAESEKLEKIDLIKIDVEGFEYKVLEGARKSIEKHKPILFIELINEYLKRNGNSGTQLVNRLAEFGYEIYDARDRSSLNSIDSLTNLHLDILCIPVR